VDGATAELGVYRGDLGVVLNSLSPKRKLYLFETFAGFPDPQGDHRFRDTSADYVGSRFPADCEVDIRATFPDTTSGLQDEQFAFVMLGADRYQVTLYLRISSGGYLFIHDYNWPEFGYGAKQACHEFLDDTPERPIELPEIWGSVVFRRSAIYCAVKAQRLGNLVLERSPKVAPRPWQQLRKAVSGAASTQKPIHNKSHPALEASWASWLAQIGS
jgi:O-methyltransferase